MISLYDCWQNAHPPVCSCMLYLSGMAIWVKSSSCVCF